MTNPFIPGNMVTITVYRATIEGTVTEVVDNWVQFRVDSYKSEPGAASFVTGETHAVDYHQVRLSDRVCIRVTADFLVDIPTWAAEYNITHTEVRDDVRNYLTTALSEIHPLLTLKGVVQ